jgi:endonuclease/exonuclease/phosphatase family metal-dependent hydrolase
MSLRIATFNVENLMYRFDYSGFRNQLYQDRTLSLFEIGDEDEYRRLEQMRVIAHTDDTRQLTALAIAATRADIVCLQEVDNLEALNAFEYGYLYKMVGKGYRHKYLTSGNDMRGIDVAAMMRDETAHGDPIEFVRMTSHAHVTFAEYELYDDDVRRLGVQPQERVFRRDCLEIDLRVGGRPVTLYCLHLKSMGGPRDGVPGRLHTLPIRRAELRAVRRIIEDRFGAAGASRKRWIVCGDFNDYRERIVITGDPGAGYRFEPVREAESSLDVLLDDGFAVDPAQRLPALERWTLYHTRGPEERHLCQLDYILLSPALARSNPEAKPEIIRAGQPWRTILPPGQEVERFPRIGWDRPKASDHCPLVLQLDIV